MYTVLGIIKVKPEHLNSFVENVEKHARDSAQEPGCLRYDVMQDRNDRQTICLYEVFRSEADFKAHLQQDYYKRWMEMSRDWRDESAYSRRVLDHIHPPASEWT
jgi:autoinducer 2-degrading protein